MIPRSFEYHDPASPEEALALLGQYGEDAKLMAGGQSLLPMMKYRLASPSHIIDLWRVRELDALREVDGEIRIGALATHRAIEDSSLLQRLCPLLAKTAGMIGDAQVRNLGTIGGSIAHADPAANYPPVLVALDAQFVLRSAGGERSVAAAQFFKGLFTTDLGPAELVTEVRVPVLAAGTGWEFLKVSRRAADFSIVNVATVIRTDQKGVCAQAVVVLGGVEPVPLRAAAVEAALQGNRLEPATIARAAQRTALGPDTASDVHADAAYRRDVAPVCVRRALEAAAARIGR